MIYFFKEKFVKEIEKSENFPKIQNETNICVLCVRASSSV